MIDVIDHRIINILKINSRFSFAEIGRKVSLSPSSVRERIQKLEELGVIKSYSVQLNQTLLGNGLEVFIMLKIFDGKLQDILREVTTYPEVQQVFRITGPYNIHMQVVLKDQLHLQHFIDKLTKFGSPTTHLILSEITKNED
ncbi:Lrp/AsnC family transcriptional regulator [Halpernia sp.]|uniref:Lrp/AsnC family transcriptional regulator n=1 Tax=Halpernia sp. TaxID=2782209 RepID=UPI003A8D554A